MIKKSENSKLGDAPVVHPCIFQEDSTSKLGDAQGIPFFIDNIIRSLLVKLYFYSVTSYVLYLERRFVFIFVLF